MSELIVVYDGACPFCSNYSRLLRLKDTVDSVRLIDARQTDPILLELTELGLDIDRGMVVKFDNRIYYGSDAINLLSRLSSCSDFFNSLNFLVFRSRYLSAAVYPLLRSCRNLTLWVMNIPKINNQKKEKVHE